MVIYNIFELNSNIVAVFYIYLYIYFEINTLIIIKSDIIYDQINIYISISQNIEIIWNYTYITQGCITWGIHSAIGGGTKRL